MRVGTTEFRGKDAFEEEVSALQNEDTTDEEHEKSRRARREKTKDEW